MIVRKYYQGKRVEGFFCGKRKNKKELMEKFRSEVGKWELVPIWDQEKGTGMGMQVPTYRYFRG
jgi:hypothetical protein